LPSFCFTHLVISPKPKKPAYIIALQQFRGGQLPERGLLCVAPAGTISLAFADNVSNGIEPVFAWQTRRRKRETGEVWREYVVEDHAYRCYRHLFGQQTLPPYFVTALDLSAQQHLNLVAAVAPYVDAAISKTVNVAADYPFEDFQQLYWRAWESGLKGLTTYRPNQVTGAVCVPCA